MTRQVNIEYDPLWSTPQQAQPDERVFPSQVWQPFAPSSYAPSVWTLVHPAYGVVMASMDVNGHQVTSNYDDLGRPLTVWPDDAATQTFSYQGRDDSYGGQNGLVVTAQVDQSKTIRSTDAAGRTIQTTHTGFNGVLIDTDVSYDLLGRAVSVSRPYDAGSAVGPRRRSVMTDWAVFSRRCGRIRPPRRTSTRNCRDDDGPEQ